MMNLRIMLARLFAVTAAVLGGGYLHLYCIALSWRIHPEYSGADEKLVMYWAAAVVWVLPFLVAGIPIGLFIKWAIGKNGEYWAAVISGATMLLLIVSGKYVVQTFSISAGDQGLTTVKDGSLLLKYLVNILSSASGGLLGGFLMRRLLGWRSHMNGAEQARGHGREP